MADEWERCPISCIQIATSKSCLFISKEAGQCWEHSASIRERDDQWQPLYLLLGFKDVTPEDIAGTISSDIAEDLQVLGIMRDVEDPIGRTTEKCTENGSGSNLQQGNLCGHGQDVDPTLALGSTSFLVTCRLQEKIISILIRAVSLLLIQGNVGRFPNTSKWEHLGNQQCQPPMERLRHCSII